MNHPRPSTFGIQRQRHARSGERPVPSLRGPWLVAVLVAVGAVLTGCGGGSGAEAEVVPTSSAPAATTPTNLTPDQQAALVAYQDCLQKNGVDPATAAAAGGGGFSGAGGGFAGPGGAIDPNASRGSRPQGVPGSLGADGAGGFRGGAGGGSIPPWVSISPELQAARDACQSLQPTFGGGQRGGAAQNPAQFAAYLSCLTDNGVAVNPPAGGVPTAPPASAPPGSALQGGRGGFGGNPLGGIDRTSPAFAAANEKCAVLLPAGTQLPGADQAGAAPTSR